MGWPQPLTPREPPWQAYVPDEYVPGRRPLPPVTLRSAWLNLLLFVLTAASVFQTHGLLWQALPHGGGVVVVDWLAGTQIAVSLLAILLAHEFGHWITARRHGVDASLPYFIPFPLSPAGTLGAFIRIRALIPHREALFDIGAAGPLAGFVVCLPVLVLGVLQGQWVPLQNGGEGPGYFGEPLLFQWAVAWIKGPTPEGMTLEIGPFGMAAWFGLFVTALNLMPVGQLDGGHITFALLPRRALWVSRLGVLLCLGLVWLRPTWLLWALMLALLGLRPHPPTWDHERPVGRGRYALGLVSLAVFVLSFTPEPVLISWPQFLELLGLT